MKPAIIINMSAKKNKNKKPISKNRFAGRVIGVFLLLIIGLSPHVRAIEFKLDANYNKEVWELNQEINERRKAIDTLNKQAEAYKKSLASKRREIASLSYQISTINQTITKISLEKEALELKIEEVNLQIQNTQLKIQATEEEAEAQKERMAVLVRTLYQADKENNLLAILATSNSMSDYFSQIQTLESIQSELLNGLDHLNTLKTALVDEQSALDNDKEQINKLREELLVKETALEDQKDVKFELIEDTKGEEVKYQQLLQDLKDEQNRINNDIVNLEQVAREKLNRQLQAGKDLGNGPMEWPIPSRTITAYFHDPDYPYRNIFEHPAIDIRSPQGSSVRAALGGYVARAKDAGMGYNYIMLVHDNGLSTVYGHLSALHVTEGSFVTQGQVIGLSGGKPGTPGAGRLTTGSHLHFEVRLNGIPVNPLNYLSN